MIATQLWKEWRSQRVLVCATVWIIPILALAVALLLRRSGSLSSENAFWISVACFLGVIAVHVPALITREVPRVGTLYLDRVPGGMRAGVIAKCIAVLAVLLLATIVSILGTALAAWAVPEVQHVFVSTAFLPLLLAVGIALAFWLLMTTCWLPYSALALLGGLLGAILLAWPFALFEHSYLLRFTGIDLAWVSASVLIAATMGVAVALPRGLRYGRRGGVALLWSFPALGLMMSSLGAWSAYRSNELACFAPTAPDAVIQECRIAEGGRFAYLNYKRDRNLSYAAVVDLQSGTWEQVGQQGTVFVPTSLPDRSYAFDNRTQCFEIIGVLEPGYRFLTWLDARTQSELLHEAFGADLPHKDPRDPLYWAPHSLEERVRAERAQHSALRTASGHRAWLLNSAIEWGAASGSAERAKLPGTKPAFFVWQDEYAFRMNDMSDVAVHGIYDLHRSTLVSADPLLGSETHSFACLASGWIAAWTKGEVRRWRSIDPHTLRLREMNQLKAEDVLLRNLGGDRLLVQRGDHFDVVDLARDTREPVMVPAGLGDCDVPRQKDRTSAGAPVLTMRTKSGARIARFDEAERRFATTAEIPLAANEEASCVGVLDETTAIVLVAGRRIVRACFDGTAPELLFPR